MLVVEGSTFGQVGCGKEAWEKMCLSEGESVCVVALEFFFDIAGARGDRGGVGEVDPRVHY